MAKASLIHEVAKDVHRRSKQAERVFAINHQAIAGALGSLRRPRPVVA
jgi:hypothetical protein